MYPPDALRRFVNPGDLCFDIGAHEGKHTGWLLELGARVIAVEPQHVDWPHAGQGIGNVKRLYYAISDHEGFAEMAVSPGHTYMSTLEPEYTKQVQAHADYPYSPETINVTTITLNDLIERFGVPAFCKIDVEGHERKVFDGLSQALPALSFEVHDFDSNKASYCIEKLNSLGAYDYFYSARESFDLGPLRPAWGLDLFGDIYAVLQ